MESLSEKHVFRYLIGDLTDAEQEETERRLLADESSFEALQVAEDELIDAYVRGELSAEDRERFQEHFLRTPSRRERLQFARAFHQALHEKTATSEELPWWRAFFILPRIRLPLAAAALLVVACGLWILVERWRPDDGARAGPGAPASPPVSAGPIASFVLSPGLLRDSAPPPRLVLPAGVAAVEMRLELEAGAALSDYRCRLETAEGVLIRDGVQPAIAIPGQAVTLRLSPELLASGDYILTLSGRAANQPYEVVASYSFRVIRK